MTLLVNCLLIFFARIVDVSLATIQTLILVRGKKFIGAIIGFIDITIWYLVAREALIATDANAWIVFSYALGYATGSYVGASIEEKLAIGSVSIQIITHGIKYHLVDEIRKQGYAVSAVTCQGIETENLLLIIEIERKKIGSIMKIVDSIAPDSFVTISDVRQTINGYLGKDK